jgi:hypothetical protein
MVLIHELDRRELDELALDGDLVSRLVDAKSDQNQAVAPSVNVS